MAPFATGGKLLNYEFVTDMWRILSCSMWWILSCSMWWILSGNYTNIIYRFSIPPGLVKQNFISSHIFIQKTTVILSNSQAINTSWFSPTDSAKGDPNARVTTSRSYLTSFSNWVTIIILLVDQHYIYAHL